jgi:hypothetical protein
MFKKLREFKTIRRTLSLFIAVALTATISYSTVKPYADSERIPSPYSDPSLAGVTPMYGDFNANNKITITDLIYMYKYIANPDRAYAEVLDCYLDGKNDIVDFLCLVNYLLGKEPHLPVRPDTQPPTVGYAEKPADEEVKLKTNGNTFTIVNWNDIYIPGLVNAYTGNWDGVTFNPEIDSPVLKENPATPTGATINYVNKAVGSAEIVALYDQMMRNGADIDVFFAEADFIIQLMERDSYTATMADLGFEESDWANAYPYTLEIAKTSEGVLKSATSQASVGGYAYRADLAEKYLGVKTPTEMQALISDWDKFETTAEKLKTVTNGGMFMADTDGGVFQAYQTGEKWLNNGKITMTDSNRNFASMAKRFMENGYVSDANQWSTAWYQLGQKEQTLGYFVANWMYQYNNPTSIPTLISFAGGDTSGDRYSSLVEGGVNSVGKWNICQGPEAFYWGGIWTLINANTDNGLEARDFIYETTINESTMHKISVQTDEFLNNQVVMDKIAEERYFATEPNDGELFFNNQNYTAVLAQAGKEISLNYKDITKYDSALKYTFLNEVSAYAEGTNQDYTDVDSTIEGYFRKSIENTGLEVE